ncbi:unnamed protein product, partial [Polarella glacialis]
AVAQRAEQHISTERAQLHQRRRRISPWFLAESRTVGNLLACVYDSVRCELAQQAEAEKKAGPSADEEEAPVLACLPCCRPTTRRADDEPDGDVQQLWQRLDAAKAELLRCAPGEAFATLGPGLDRQRMREVLGSRRIDPAQLKLVRQVFLDCVGVSYWEQAEHLPGGETHTFRTVLLNSVKLADDHTASALVDWAVIKESLGLEGHQQKRQ